VGVDGVKEWHDPNVRPLQTQLAPQGMRCARRRASTCIRLDAMPRNAGSAGLQVTQLPHASHVDASERAVINGSVARPSCEASCAAL